MEYQPITLEDIKWIIGQQMLLINLEEDDIYEYADRQEQTI